MILIFGSAMASTISFFTSRASDFKLAKAGASLMARSFKFCFKVVQVKSTADPTVDVVPDPPCEGPGGKSESPNLNLIFSIGICIAFAAMMVMEVVVPGPISLTAHSNVNFPSLFNKARTEALPLPAPKTPFAIPYPINHPFSFNVPGVLGRFFQPIFSFP